MGGGGATSRGSRLPKISLVHSRGPVSSLPHSASQELVLPKDKGAHGSDDVASDADDDGNAASDRGPSMSEWVSARSSRGTAAGVGVSRLGTSATEASDVEVCASAVSAGGAESAEGSASCALATSLRAADRGASMAVGVVWRSN